MLASIKSALQRDGFRRYLGNTSWLLGEKFLRLTVGLFVGIWLARYLGPEQFGTLSYAESFVAIFSAFMTLGLNSIVVRELVGGKTSQDVLLGTALGLRVAGSLCMLLLVLIAVYGYGIDRQTNSIVLIIALAAAFRIFEVIDFYFQARVISRYSAISNGCVVIASSFLKIYLILIKAPLITFACVFLFDTFLLAALYLYFYQRRGESVLSFKFRSETARKLLSDSWPLIFSGILISIYMKIDQVMVREYLGEWHVGQYAAAVRLSDAWLFITVVITSSLFPAIVNAKNISSDLFEERMTRLYKLLVFISLVISCVIFIFSEQLVLLTFGTDYASAIPVLQLYIWSIVFVFLNNASWKWYIAENLQKIAMLRLCLGAIVNIGLNMLFIPRFGLEGAAYATLISYVMATYLGNALHPRTLVNFRMQTRALLTFYTFNR
jgi:O-antigen/teichoic acid export membrane protein